MKYGPDTTSFNAFVLGNNGKEVFGANEVAQVNRYVLANLRLDLAACIGKKAENIDGNVGK